MWQCSYKLYHIQSKAITARLAIHFFHLYVFALHFSLYSLHYHFATYGKIATSITLLAAWMMMGRVRLLVFQ